MLLLCTAAERIISLVEGGGETENFPAIVIEQARSAAGANLSFEAPDVPGTRYQVYLLHIAHIMRADARDMFCVGMLPAVCIA